MSDKTVECPACGFDTTEDKLKECPWCGGQKCEDCDMGNNVGCVVCDNEEEE